MSVAQGSPRKRKYFEWSARLRDYRRDKVTRQSRALACGKILPILGVVPGVLTADISACALPGGVRTSAVRRACLVQTWVSFVRPSKCQGVVQVNTLRAVQ